MFCARCGTWAPDDTVTCTLCGHSVMGDAGPVPVGSDRAAAIPAATVAYGGFWRRFMAAVVDAIVLFFPAATLRVLLGLNPIAMFDPDTPASFVAGTGELALGWIYAALLIGSSARGTLGQQVMGIYVSGLHGERVTFARATWRYFAQVLTLLTMGVGYLLQLVTPRRQTLHDVVSATVVVRVHAEAAPALRPAMRLAP